MDQMISEHSIVVASQDQLSGNLPDGDVVILSLKDGMYYGLNPVGGRIWSLIQEPKAIENLKEILLQEFDIDAKRCTSEILILLEGLLSNGLIEIKNG